MDGKLLDMCSPRLSKNTSGEEVSSLIDPSLDGDSEADLFADLCKVFCLLGYVSEAAGVVAAAEAEHGHHRVSSSSSPATCRAVIQTAEGFPKPVWKLGGRGASGVAFRGRALEIRAEGDLVTARVT
nr:unnamed protein product [Digitaria exilis]